jgi:DNA modification methylase
VSNISAIIDVAKPALKETGSLWLNIGDTYFARWSSIRSNGRQGLGDNDRLRRKTPMGGYRQEKQLLLIPARTAIALQDRRWILRNDLIWYKPNVPPRPERDRLPLTHEHFFHFVKRPKEGRAKYYYDLAEVGDRGHDVVTQNVRPGKGGHSATSPEDLIRPRIISSSPALGVVVDPFAGTGTTVIVANKFGRIGIGFEINQRYTDFGNAALASMLPF